MPAGNGLSSEHVEVLMLENRSFDRMLGFLYTDNGNVSASGQPYGGLNPGIRFSGPCPSRSTGGRRAPS
jgi:hypothetical protein